MLGRFISADMIVPDGKNPQQFNRYAYGLNNPVKYRDPSGHMADDLSDGIGLQGTINAYYQGHHNPTTLINDLTDFFAHNPAYDPGQADLSGASQEDRILVSSIQSAFSSGAMAEYHTQMTLSRMGAIEEGAREGSTAYHEVADMLGKRVIAPPAIKLFAPKIFPPALAAKITPGLTFLVTASLGATALVLDRDAKSLSDYADWLDNINLKGLSANASIEFSVLVNGGEVTVSCGRCGEPFVTSTIPGTWSGHFVRDMMISGGDQ
jgi:hypothetical protein